MAVSVEVAGVKSSLEGVVAEARSLVAGLEVEDLSGAAAREMVAEFAELERLAGAGKMLATGRLVASGAGPGDDSFRDVDSWLASVAGTTVGAARSASKAAVRVLDQPVVAAAVRSGALSGVQAELVASAASADPAAADRLVGVARYAGVKGLRSECDRVIAAAASREQEQVTADHVYRQRSARQTCRAAGSGTIVITGPTDRTAAIMAALEPIERELFEENRRNGHAEHPDAVAFDAFVRLAATFRTHGPSGTSGGRPLATIHLHVSEDAFRRGYTEPGEICEISGFGPVPVSTAVRLSSDAVIKALVTDGVDISRVVHLGRAVPAHLRTGVETRDPVCVIDGCEVDRHLELDHNIPWAQGGATSYENLGRPCTYHHDLKSRLDLRRLGPPGRQRLVTRDEYERATREPRAG